jgi:hypothetical protein
MTVEEAHTEVKYGWEHVYIPEALAHAVDSLKDEPLGYRINIFLARLCFRGIYFPMRGKMAWLKVVAQNGQTISRLAREALFGRRAQPTIPASTIRMKKMERGWNNRTSRRFEHCQRDSSSYFEECLTTARASLKSLRLS